MSNDTRAAIVLTKFLLDYNTEFSVKVNFDKKYIKLSGDSEETVYLPFYYRGYNIIL